jgi:hypothetical protein
MSLQEKVEQARDDVAALEQLYAQAEADGESHAFREAVARCLAQQPHQTLFLAWAYRLKLLPENQNAGAERRTYWQSAIGISLGLGLVFLLLAGGKPPVPVPELERPQFWLGWSPALGLAVLAFLFAVNRVGARAYALCGIGIAALSVPVLLTFWHRTDFLAVLATLHFPFVIWAVIGGSVIHSQRNRAAQFHAFTVKSIEIILTGGIYLGAFLIFLMLTFGIFSVIDIKISERLMRNAVAWGMGSIAILSLASIYSPAVAPVAQNVTMGLTRLLGILTRLLLPLTLAVLAVYAIYFIPMFFWRPFEERNVLIVYNATIMAVLVLISLCVAHSDGQTRQQRSPVWYGLAILVSLTGLLNLYAVMAVMYRTLAFGLTPNRYAVLGWNVMTLLILGATLATLLRSPGHTWASDLRETLGRSSAYAAAWSLWVLLVLPFSFD